MPKIYYNTFKNYNNSVLSSETGMFGLLASITRHPLRR